MSDMTPFEEVFEERLRAFARTGVKAVDSAEVARAAAVGTQRRARRIPWGFGARRTTDRWPVAAAAVIAVIVVGGALFLMQRRQPAVIAVPTPPPSAEPSPSLRGVVPPNPTPSASEPAGPSAGPTSSVVPGREGFWIATGSMGTPRRGHTAVRLLDGRVLVAGGYQGDEPDLAVTSAELYDPESGTWSATGSMLKPRAGFPATLLRDGRVLVGDVEDPAPDTGTTGAEVYDPDSGTWAATGKMIRDVSGDAQATLLRDGKVLVTSFGDADLYDPDSGTWSSTGKMIGPAAQHAAVLLADGTVLVVKGDHLAPSAELFDPATGTWAATANMHGSYNGVTAVLLRDGKVLVEGSPFNEAGSLELYDPATRAWTAMGKIPTDGVATLLSDGKVLAAGEDGYQVFDPDRGTWTATAKKVTPAGGPATLLLDGTVLVAGGPTGSAELYVPEGVTPPTGLPTMPPPTPTPTPTPAPTPVLPQAGPDGSWTITVSNSSSQPARLFVAEETEQGLMGQRVGSATPNVVLPGTTVEVSFLVPAPGVDGWSIFVRSGPNTKAVVGWTDVPPSGSIHVNEEGLAGFMGES